MPAALSFVCSVLLATAPATEPTSPSPATTQMPPPPPSLRPLGVGLAASGAGLAALGTVGFTLVEGLTRPDRSTAKPSANLELFTQAGGFAALAVASASAVLLLAGGALVLADVAPAAPSSPPPATVGSPAPGA